MPTKGKSWKWKATAKRSWKWNEEKRKAKEKYKCDDKRIVKCFCWMQNRCKRNSRRTSFTRTSVGFAAFVAELGPIPERITRPSVGRKDHNKGYVYGNIVWEQYEYNRWKRRRTEEEVHHIKEESADEIPF